MAGRKFANKPHVFAQAQNRLLGAQGAVELVVFPVAHRAKQHGVTVHGQLECGFGQGVAKGIVSRAADQGGFHLELQVESVQDFDGFSDDFGADAITGEDCDFHGVRRACSQ